MNKIYKYGPYRFLLLEGAHDPKYTFIPGSTRYKLDEIVYFMGKIYQIVKVYDGSGMEEVSGDYPSTWQACGELIGAKEQEEGKSIKIVEDLFRDFLSIDPEKESAPDVFIFPDDAKLIKLGTPEYDDNVKYPIFNIVSCPIIKTTMIWKGIKFEWVPRPLPAYETGILETKEIPEQEICIGWQCPLCGAVNAPHIEQCPCSVRIISGTGAAPISVIYEELCEKKQTGFH